ncbi:hypothetical protein BDR04DRAFT_1111935 [Suillus decipiens]|nr:hypothetical protein BDR04DRAFT_1111935 [Suillus decipiens]
MSLTGETKEIQTSRFLVLKHGQRRVMVRRQRSYNLMVDSACKCFPSIPKDMIMLQTNQLDVCDGHYADITAEIWDDVIDLLRVVEVTRREEMTVPVPLPLDARAISSPDDGLVLSQVNEQDSCGDSDEITVNVVFPSGEIRPTKISREMRVNKLVADASQIVGHCPTPLKAAQFGKGGGMGPAGAVILRGKRSIGSYDIKDGDIISILFSGPGPGGVVEPEDPSIHFKKRVVIHPSFKNENSINDHPKGRLMTKKPVIYLYSPSNIDVSIKLSLIPEWTLSALYPVVTTEGHGQRLEWNVRTHRDGSLTEHNSGVDVSYLFWEAETNLQAFPSSASKQQSVDTFNPISSSLDDMDSIVIPVDKATVYLDKSLKVLGLHTEARTSFISYWLPYILKHEYIALRFVPQSAYERAASLSISPQPDVVTRVFMLFRGIFKEHLANWSNAHMRAEKDVAWWVDVVGVDVARAGDTALFRVLEWGAMEVLV